VGKSGSYHLKTLLEKDAYTSKIISYETAAWFAIANSNTAFKRIWSSWYYHI